MKIFVKFPLILVYIFTFINTAYLFSGNMLVNWIVSEFKENNTSQLIDIQDLKLLAIQFCTDLLAAHVLKQLPDKDVPMHNIFKVSKFVEK